MNNGMPRALIVDDDRSFQHGLAEVVEREGFKAVTAGDLAEARAELAQGLPDALLIDLNLPDGSGMELLDEVAGNGAPEVILITGQATVETAIEALRRGAADYLTKPVDFARLKTVLANLVRTRELKREIGSLRGELRRLGRFGPLVGASAAMQKLYDLLARISRPEATVLVLGETGTGKELVAQTIHSMSRRAKEAFVPVNCGAVSPTLIESELFGHERGSFTGADRSHRGYFERANRGTLFLDEITEMPLELQVKLLRVLETGTLSRVGGTETVKVDVRDHRGHEPAAGRGGGGRQAARGPALSPERASRSSCRRCASAATTSSCWPSTSSPSSTRRGRPRSASRAPPSIGCAATPGRATCASCGTSSSARTSWRRTTSASTRCPSERPGRRRARTAWCSSVGTSIAEAERRLILATLEHFEGDKKKAAAILKISLKTLYNRLNVYHAGG